MSHIANCPQCKKFRVIKLQRNQLVCEACQFKLDVLCVYCGVGQLQGTADNLVCSHCQMSQTTDQLAYILENRLKVNLQDRCQYCNSPTLSKLEANVQPRCFDHPNCGNQALLFESKKSEKAHIFLDFETTGLEIGNESIIEIGACKVDQDGKEYFFQELIRPVSTIKPLITKITGIDDSMVKFAPHLKDVLREFLKFCGDGIIIAHNAQFDVPWLLTSLMRHQFEVPFDQVLCTLNWAKSKEEGKRSLGALSKKYNIGHENAHRALADAVVTKSLFYIYEKDSESKPFESIDRYVDISKKILSQFPEFVQA